MKKQVLKILDKNTNNWRKFNGNCFDKAAKEIEAHVFEYIKWLVEGDFYEMFDQETDAIGISHYENLYDGEIYSFNELYDYWLKNIKRD